MIEKCPQYGYLLKGLPAEHVCPECGLAYDEQSKVYDDVGPKPLLVVLVWFLFGGAAVLEAIDNSENLSPSWRIAIIVAWAAYGAIFAWLIWRCWRLYRRGPLVAVLSAGLYLRYRKPDAELKVWGDVTQVRVRPGRIAVELGFKNSAYPRFVDDVFKSHEDAERFATQVRTRAAIEEPTHNLSEHGTESPGVTEVDRGTRDESGAPM